jgi:hypothetical protein
MCGFVLCCLLHNSRLFLRHHYNPPRPNARPDAGNTLTFWSRIPISVACCPLSLHLLHQRRIPGLCFLLPNALGGRVLHPECAEDPPVCHRDTPLECHTLYVRTRPGQKPTTALLPRPFCCTTPSPWGSLALQRSKRRFDSV